jgi:succinyl-CoA synthetase alpha subunit/citrate synthase
VAGRSRSNGLTEQRTNGITPDDLLEGQRKALTMRAKTLADLLKKDDRVAISNITGREASKVCLVSQAYCGNIVGGWALGRGGETIRCPKDGDIPVFADCAGLMRQLPPEKRPNKVVVYSPPPAVYGDVKETLSYGSDCVETIFIITEHVSVEVSAKIHNLARDANIDVVGCNTLGVINTHDHARVGAIGGDDPEETFLPGGATIVSNSGNMVNTIATYLASAGIGTSFGISTGKDVLILTPPVDFLRLAQQDEHTRIVVMYVEPGGLYEREALALAQSGEFTKPLVVYVAGRVVEKRSISLGHAGSVVEGGGTSASAKAAAFDEYFGTEPFSFEMRYRQSDKLPDALKRGIRVRSLHDIPAAVQLVYRALGIDRDFPPKGEMKLNPWFVNLGDLSKRVPAVLIPTPGKIPPPWNAQFEKAMHSGLGATLTRRSMRNQSYASSNDGKTTRIYGRDVKELMKERSFGESLILYWTGEEAARPFEPKLVEMSLIAALTNGPGTLSAQAAKLSASAGNSPHTAMIATLATIGDSHGGNGREAVKFLSDIFRPTPLKDPYDPRHGLDIKAMALQTAQAFKQSKDAAKDAGVDYARIPCLGHPVFRDEDVNYDPRERAIAAYMESQGIYSVFLDFYHALAHAVRDVGVSKKVWAVNVDAAIATIWLGIAWPKLRDRKMTFERAADLAFLGFALGRAAGGAGEFLDHRDYGTPLDMRIPVEEFNRATGPTAGPATQG